MERNQLKSFNIKFEKLTIPRSTKKMFSLNLDGHTVNKVA
jgi:hypothetical protein